jgi:hypothetical protein
MPLVKQTWRISLKLNMLRFAVYLARNWTYQWSGDNCRYGLDMGSFWLRDNCRIIADSDTFVPALLTNLWVKVGARVSCHASGFLFVA